MRFASAPSRREFLKAGALAFVAGACTRPPYDPRRFAHPSTSPVLIASAPHYEIDVADLIYRSLRELRVDVTGRSVLLKPNLVEFQPGSPINTDPRVVVGAASALLRAGASRVVVGEGPGHRRDIEYLLEVTGLATLLHDERLTFTDLNHDDVEMVELASHFTGMRQLALPVEVLAADLVVSMPKLKTHHWAGLTASMKNLFGVVPGAVYGWPKNLLHFRGIPNSIVDLAATIRPALAIVDGIVGMEGDGPIMGKARELGCLVLGTDVVAVDATCAHLIGMDPSGIDYLAMAGGFLGNLRETSIEQRGELIARFATRFEPPPQAQPGKSSRDGGV